MTSKLIYYVLVAIAGTSAVIVKASVLISGVSV